MSLCLRAKWICEQQTLETKMKASSRGCQWSQSSELSELSELSMLPRDGFRCKKPRYRPRTNAPRPWWNCPLHHQRCVSCSPDLHESAASLPMFLQQPDVSAWDALTSWGSGIFQHCSTCFIMFHCSNCSYIRLVCDSKGLGKLGKSCESSNTLPCWHPVQRRPVTCFATLWAKRTLLSCREQRQKPMSSKAKAKSQITRIAKGETAANVRNRIHTAAA